MPKTRNRLTKKRFWQIITLFFIIILAAFIVSNSDTSKIKSYIPHLLSAYSTVSFTVSINVDATPPITFIDTIENTTYDSKNIDLNFTIEGDNIDQTWYSLGNGENITLTENISIVMKRGNNIFYLYSNDTTGNLNRTTINFVRSGPVMTQTEFDNLTDFDHYTDDELQNITNLTIEIIASGKFEFLESVNISASTDLDANIEISDNLISLDSSVLTNFNKSANLYFYGLTFTNPRILRDNVVCPDTICKKIDYAGGILKFNVTHFTSYSSEETPSDSPSGGGSSGGGSSGGGGSSLIINPFTVAEDSIKVKLKQGSTTTESLTITNNLDRPLKINIATDIERLILIQEDSFTLNPKQTKKINIDLFAPEDIEPELYIGTIFIMGEGTQRTLRTTVEVIHLKSLFDVEIDIPSKYRQVYPGEDLLATVRLFSVERVGLTNVELEYLLRDEKSNTIYTESETISVDVQTSFLKELRIPEDLPPGNYLLYIRAKFGDSVGSSSTFFQVVELQTPKKEGIKILEGISILDGIKMKHVYIGIIVILTILIIRRSFMYLSGSRTKKEKIVRPYNKFKPEDNKVKGKKDKILVMVSKGGYVRNRRRPAKKYGKEKLR